MPSGLFTLGSDSIHCHASASTSISRADKSLGSDIAVMIFWLLEGEICVRGGV